jgi:hypothetical protein
MCRVTSAPARALRPLADTARPPARAPQNASAAARPTPFGPSPSPLPQDAVYPFLITDAAGKPVASPSKYTLTFKKGEAPPVGAFWSVTM